MAATTASTLIPGWQTGHTANDAIFREVFTEVSTLAAIPLVGNLESACTRVEALCGMLGKMSAALVNLVPAANKSTNNLTSVAIHVAAIEARIEANLANLQAQAQQMEQKIRNNRSSTYSKTAAKSTAFQGIKPLISEKKKNSGYGTTNLSTP